MRDRRERTAVELEQSDAEFLYLWSGGHPGLLTSATQLLINALDREGAAADHWVLQRRLAPILRESPVLARESQKIWQNCSEAERQALLALFAGQPADETVLSRLEEKHILIRVENELRAFSRLFFLFALGKQTQNAPVAKGLWVDADSGEVLVDGVAAETLTKLEYQLMTLLFENADKIIDKYQIVTGV